MNNQIDEPVCCPRLDPELWENKVFEWSHKRFVKDKVFTFFFIPINFGQVMTRLTKRVEDVGGKMPDSLCLSYHTSKWNMNLYLAVDKEIPNAENVEMSGKFFSKVYEGGFQETEKWCKDFEMHAKEKSLMIENMFMWYTTCPKCAKKYGKNYVVIIAKV